MDTSSNPAVSPPTSARSGPRAGHRPRRWLPYVGGLLLVGGLTFGLWPDAVRVEVAPAVEGPLRTSVDEEGQTRIRHRYVVSAPVGGHLRRIELKAGSPVEAGQTAVAVIDPVVPALLDARSRSLAEARRDTAAANLEKAQAAQRFAASELRRFEHLALEQTISPQELEAAQWRQTAAAREEAAAASALRVAEAELAVFTAAGGAGTNGVCSPFGVLAPATGRVLRVFEESSRVVPAGTPLVEVGDPADLEVVIEVLSRDGATLGSGTPVELDQWGGDEPLRARVRLVEPSAFTKVSALGVEEQRVNVIADLLTPPEKRGSLGDKFRVEARLITWETNRTLKVPAGALFRQQESWRLYVLTSGRARERTVTVGRSSGTETEIIAGLQEGESVILYPGDRVRPGLRVKPVTF